MMFTTFTFLEVPSKFCFLFEPYFTIPSFKAKTEWSLLSLVFVPAVKLVPLCRTRIEPAFAVCPSYNLTPKYLGFESRRFLAEPPAFLCAIFNYMSFCRGLCGRRKQTALLN